VSTADVLPLKLAFPRNWAVIECVPAARLDVVSDALPPLSVALPSSVEPSKNRTVPAAAAGDTVALKVTDWPTLDGLRLDVRAVVVFAWFTVCDNADEEPPANVVSPEY
jgi:hypothetical protein